MSHRRLLFEGNPLQKEKGLFFLFSGLHLFFALLVILIIHDLPLAQTFRLLFVLLWWSLLGVPAILGGLLWTTHATRRATVSFAYRITAVAVLCIDLMLMGIVLFGMDAMTAPVQLAWLVVGVLTGYVILAIIVEYRVAPDFWERVLRGGRINLQDATFDPRIDAAPPKGGQRIWPVGVALGPAAGVIVANMLRPLFSVHIQDVIIGCMALVGSFLIAYPLCMVMSVLLRIIRWERVERRVLRIPE